MNNKIDLLDHGFVRLVSCMQPVPDSIATHDAVEHTTNGYVTFKPDRLFFRTFDYTVCLE